MDYIIDEFCKAADLGVDIERIYLVWDRLNENYLNHLVRESEEVPRSYSVDENVKHCKKRVSPPPSMPKIDEE